MATKKRMFKVYFCKVLIGKGNKALSTYANQLLKANFDFPILEIDSSYFLMKHLQKDKQGFWLGNFAKVNKDAPSIINIDRKTEHLVPLKSGEYVQEQCFFIYDPKRDITIYLLNGKAGTESRLALYIGKLLKTYTQIIRIDDQNFRKRIFNRPFYEARVKVASIPSNGGEIIPDLIAQMESESVNIGTVEVIIRAPSKSLLGKKTVKEFESLYKNGYQRMWIKQANNQDAINMLKPTLKANVHLSRLPGGEIDFHNVYTELAKIYNDHKAMLGFDEDDNDT